MQVGIGPLYDVFGRKVPVVCAMFIAAISQITIAFSINVFPMYLIGYLLTLPLLVTNTCPYVPDLIMENSHGIANTLKILVIDLANVSASGLLSLNGSFPDTFNSKNIYLGIAFACFLSGFYVIFYLKDVIKSAQFKERRLTISRNSGKPNNKCNQFCFALKQAIGLLFRELYILIGILAGTSQ